MKYLIIRHTSAWELGALAALFFVLVSGVDIAAAQDIVAANTGVNNALSAATTGNISAALLPDAPGVNSAEVGASGFSSSADPLDASAAATRTPLLPRRPVASLYDKYIEPRQTAQTLTDRDKVIFGIRQEATIYFPLGAAGSAGYSHLANGSPNYGTNSDAFAQRLGAAFARNASQNIFSDSLLAPLLHEDPRYYVMGNRRNGFARAAYAISRVLLTKSEAGDTTPNFSLLGGYAGAAGLTNAYYPPDNRGFSETAKTFGGSLGGAAFSNIVREFLPDLLHTAHFE